jgi:RNA exonuclease 4
VLQSLIKIRTVECDCAGFFHIEYSRFNSCPRHHYSLSDPFLDFKMILGLQSQRRKVKMQDEEELNSQSGAGKKKRSRRRRKPRSEKTVQTTPGKKPTTVSKRPHDAPMTKRDLYFSLHCGLVSIGHGAPAVARVTMINWDAEVVLDTFVQVPVPVTDFRDTGITADAVSTRNPQAMSFAKVRQSVNQILKGKILVGHRLKDHLTALGLVHPPSDVRDAALFRLFQYEAIDDITQQRAMVERPVSSLAAEFLQREVESTSNPMTICTASLDLYKKFREEWEASLVHQAQPEAAADLYASGSAFARLVPDSESQRRYSRIDESPRLNGGRYSTHQQRGYSWFNRSRTAGRPVAYETHDRGNSGQPMLTPENLEMLDLCRHAEECMGYQLEHQFSGHSLSSDYGVSSSLGPSAQCEGSSALSEYSFTSQHLEESLHSYNAQHQPQSNSSASWFRFGLRKSKNPQQEYSHQGTPNIPMTSFLEEEPDDNLIPLEQSSRPPIENDENLPVTSNPISNDLEKFTAEDEKTTSLSWFSIRRPKSPGPGLERSLGTQGRNRSGSLVRVVEPEDAARSAGCTHSAELEDIESWNGEHDDVSEEEKAPVSWFSFKRSKSPGPERLVKPTIPRRSSMGTKVSSDGVHSCESQANTGMICRRNSFDNGSMETSKNDYEKSTSNTTWFSFRRSSKVPGAGTKDRDLKTEFAELLQQPTLYTEASDDSEEDWLREVVGSPRTQEKELLALVAWPEGHTDGFETPPLPSPPSVNGKESKWLTRFLRSTKTSVYSEPGPRDDDVESSSRDPWLQPLVSTSERGDDRPKATLNASFFFGFEDGFDPPPGSFARSRLDTEATTPTISSETEDASHLEEFSLSSEEQIKTTMMTQDMEQNFAYLTL